MWRVNWSEKKSLVPDRNRTMTSWTSGPVFGGLLVRFLSGTQTFLCPMLESCHQFTYHISLPRLQFIIFQFEYGLSTKLLLLCGYLNVYLKVFFLFIFISASRQKITLNWRSTLCCFPDHILKKLFSCKRVLLVINDV